METAEYRIMFQAEERHWWYAALHRLIFWSLDTYVPDWKDRAILDAGCGTGAILHRLGSDGKKVGIDLSPDAIAFCEKRGLRQAQLGDITALPFAADSFDAIICSSVLYHRWVPDVDQALKELRRVLKPGGVLILNLPACESLHSKHDELVFTARRFNQDDVRALLAKSNFEIKKLTGWTTFLFPVAWLARSLKTSDKGRDFDENQAPHSLVNSLMDALMRIEFQLARLVSLPFGVAMLCVAEKRREQ